MLYDNDDKDHDKVLNGNFQAADEIQPTTL